MVAKLWPLVLSWISHRGKCRDFSVAVGVKRRRHWPSPWYPFKDNMRNGLCHSAEDNRRQLNRCTPRQHFFFFFLDSNYRNLDLSLVKCLTDRWTFIISQQTDDFTSNSSFCLYLISLMLHVHSPELRPRRDNIHPPSWYELSLGTRRGEGSQWESLNPYEGPKCDGLRFLHLPDYTVKRKTY